MNSRRWPHRCTRKSLNNPLLDRITTIIKMMSMTMMITITIIAKKKLNRVVEEVTRGHSRGIRVNWLN